MPDLHIKCLRALPCTLHVQCIGTQILGDPNHTNNPPKITNHSWLVLLMIGDYSVYSRKGGVDLHLHTFVLWASDWRRIEHTLHSRRSLNRDRSFSSFFLLVQCIVRLRYWSTVVRSKVHVSTPTSLGLSWEWEMSTPRRDKVQGVHMNIYFLRKLPSSMFPSTIQNVPSTQFPMFNIPIINQGTWVEFPLFPHSLLSLMNHGTWRGLLENFPIGTQVKVSCG